MYKNIIVGLALDHGIASSAIKFAQRLLANGGKIKAVHVMEPLHGSVSTYLTEEDSRKALKTVKDQLAERIGDVPDIEAVVLRGQTGRAITDYAEEIGADCIVIGSHKPGLSDYFLGSTAARVVRHAPCSVHVLR